MKRSIIFSNDSPNETELVLGDDFEIKVEDGKTYVVRKKPQNPKTYEECLKILGYNVGHTIPMNHGHNGLLMMKLQRLLICRDAYWKIAGGWKPDFINPDADLYVIINIYNRVEKAKYGYGFQHCILTFPTEEIRDAFYDNFNELIESCKGLL